MGVGQLGNSVGGFTSLSFVLCALGSLTLEYTDEAWGSRETASLTATPDLCNLTLNPAQWPRRHQTRLGWALPRRTLLFQGSQLRLVRVTQLSPEKAGVHFWGEF